MEPWRVRSGRHVGRERRCHSRGHLTVRPFRGGAARAGEKRSCAHRADPPSYGAPARRCRRADRGPGAHLRSGVLRRQEQESEECQRETNRRAGVKPARQRLAGHHSEQGAAPLALKPTGTKHSGFRLLTRRGRSSELPAAPSMPVQRQLSAGGTAGYAAIWASSRSHLIGRWVLLQPTLDVQLTSYDASGAPYLVSQRSCGARPEACSLHASGHFIA